MSNLKIDSDSDGNKYWRNYANQLHREDGPACIYSTGTKSWYQNGKLHRLDGPAIERADGIRSYWINDQELTEDDWKVHPLRIEYVIRENLKKILK